MRLLDLRIDEHSEELVRSETSCFLIKHILIEDIREVIKTERAAIDKKKHEKDTKKLEDSLHESYRHIQDLQFNLEGRDVALEEAKKGLAEKEAEILTKTEEIGRLKQLTELHQQVPFSCIISIDKFQKIAEMQSQFAEEKLKLQESNADLEREQTEVMGCLEKARAELAGLAEEKAKLERRLDDMEQVRVYFSPSFETSE